MLEAQHFLKTGKLESLSAQYLIDCSYMNGNRGCMGGMPIFAFFYDEFMQGIVTEKRMPYISKEGVFRPNMGVCVDEEL